MTINIKELKVPRRPRTFHGVEIKGVDFQMPYHSFVYADPETVKSYASSYWRKKEKEDVARKTVGQMLEISNRKLHWAKNREIKAKLLNDPEYQEITKQLSSLRGEIRKSKWEKMSEELLVVIHDNPYGWPIEKTSSEQRYPHYKSRPNKGDLLMCISSEEIYTKNKLAKIYSVIQNRNDDNIRVVIPEGSSLIDGVLPLNMYT